MNSHFAAGEFAEAARLALSITPLSKEELREIVERHGIKILRLDHEAFGIYNIMEPSYDLRVDGATPDVLAAAREFGKRHAQEAVLIARKLLEGEADSAGRLGLIIALHAAFTIEEALEIIAVVRNCGFRGATFVPKRGEMAIYHTDDLGMTTEQFEEAANLLLARLQRGVSSSDPPNATLSHTYAKPMNTEKSVRQTCQEWNAKAKADGRLLEQDPWTLPDLYQGSIFDVPMTPEAEERIARLRKERLEHERAAKEKDIELNGTQEEAKGRVEQVVAPLDPIPVDQSPR
jgi:hypothetical protein